MTGYKELPPNGALLLYLSADGSFPVRPQPEDTGYDLGGVLLQPRQDVEPVVTKTSSSAHVKEHCCLYPGDLFPFTRRPTFLVVDSDNSACFSSIPHYFDMPLVVLMSPQDVPASFQGKFILVKCFIVKNNALAIRIFCFYVSAFFRPKKLCQIVYFT